ncbi:metal-dependent hydrolase [Salinadaptatus halalkaliphilus]|uniref:Metal-dependent hydrolase n=1 Tax=Salinadaptatus halalkaliphilus TaxID=2419781 RepID=A0A4S3TRE4_9EURY|nr:metal-dependent hydrolase [Salinadaptatus halalkaliphilus]THE65158.1 metal-dependent hydrolase [Salinadaptatus halalkaliphilus]
MADVLTHVLAGYIIGSVLALSVDRIKTAHVTVVMVGAVVPDLAKIDLVLSETTVAATLGIPWNWTALHTLGGSIVMAGLCALVVDRRHRLLVFGLFLVGALSHHVLDLLLLTWDGRAYPVLWPLTGYRPPSGGLYMSSDRWPLLLATTIGTILWLCRRRFDASMSTDPIDRRDN